MSDYGKKKEWNDIVTEYAFEKPRSTGELRERPQPPNVPRTIGFLLPNQQVLTASTEREITLGRRSRPEDPEVTIDLKAFDAHRHGISRYHAMLAVVRNVLTIRDLNSVNGTRLNDIRITPLKGYVVHDGDVIGLGTFKIKLIFDYKG